MRVAGNEYNRLELAGAFGDLGTLVPFVVGYITVSRLVPCSLSGASASGSSPSTTL